MSQAAIDDDQYAARLQGQDTFNVTGRVPVSTVKEDWQGEPGQWWGYSKEHGWVVLDRSIPCNAPALAVDLLFLRCRDATTFSEKRERWIPPHSRFAPNYVRDLAPPDAQAATVEFANLKLRWPEFESAIQRVCQVSKDPLQEEKGRKRSDAKTNRPLGAAKA